MIKLSKPYIPSNTNSIIEQVLTSGNLVQGENVLAFESELADYLNTDHVVIVSSGTAALHLALLALDIKKGDEVIVPAYSFPAVANAVELTGASCVFADITLDDYCMDANMIESLISPNTKAIMPVHEFGQATDMSALLPIAKKHNLFVVEDAACAIGTKYDGRFAGTIGDLGCLSFHPRKILTTGEGGAVVTKNAALAEKLRLLRNHGMQPANGLMDFVMPGFNYRLTDFQAAMGRTQLVELAETIAIHRAQAAYYHQKFDGADGIKTDRNFENRFQTYQTYHIIFENTDIRNHIKSELYKSGIESNIGAYAIPPQSYYRQKYNLPVSHYRMADIAFRCGLALPIGRHLQEDDLAFISSSVIKLIQDGL